MWKPANEKEQKRKEKIMKWLVGRKSSGRRQLTERKHQSRHLGIGPRIIEKENVMIQDPRMGTAPQTISQSL